MRLSNTVLVTANAHTTEQYTLGFVIDTHKSHPCLCKQQNLDSTLVRFDQLLQDMLIVYCSI